LPVFLIILVGLSKANSQEIENQESDSYASDGEAIGDVGIAIEEAGIDSVALTPMRYYKPASSNDFLIAAVCHDLTNDVYGIAAVFQTTYGQSLYYIRVGGDNGTDTFGEFLGATYVDGSTTSIESVDCAQDGQDSIFIAYSKYNAHARWVRFVGSTMIGGYHDIVPVYGCDFDGEGNPTKTHKPRIAFQNDAGSGNETIILAYHGRNWTVDFNSCEWCIETFHAYTGNFIQEQQGAQGGQAVAWDIEWNGGIRYELLQYFGSVEEHSSQLKRQQFSWNGNKVGSDDVLYDFNAHPEVPKPNSQIRLAYTDGNLNYSHRFILQTDTGVTFWLTQTGGLYDNPIYNFGGGFGDNFAVCEYWGNQSNKIAHTYNYDMIFLPGPPPSFIPTTIHNHWHYAPAYPLDVYFMNQGYLPRACNAADTTSDSEVIVVSDGGAGGYVFWNIWPQN
jgi:hypothetical protein